MTEPIIIEEYNPQWPESFEQICSRIKPAIGKFAAAIEHVGSTAVPGLAAKPVIDIDVLLKSDKDIAPVTKKLAGLGYEHRGTLGIAGRDAFRAPAHDIRHHLYVCAAEGREFFRHLAFRDYLRRHPNDAADYARLKKSLSGKFSIDREAYTEAKTEFIEEILRRTSLEKAEHLSRAHRTNN